MTPIEPIVEALVSRLDASLREFFEERAGVLEWEAGKPRALAEALAFLEVVRAYPHETHKCLTNANARRL